MRKSLKIVLIVLAIVVAIVIIGVTLFFVLAKDKTPITADDFKTIMEEKGYIITDATYKFASYDEYINQVYIASSDDYSYQIEFYVIQDSEYAEMFYSSNKQVFENSKTSGYSQSSISLKNYSKYTLSTGEKYKVLSRVENTVIYVNADETYKDTIKAVLNELGY